MSVSLTPQQRAHAQVLIRRVGRELRRARLERRRASGYTQYAQQQIAELMGCFPTEASRIECGRTNPTLAKVAKFLDHFGLTLIVVPKEEGERRDREFEATDDSTRYRGGCDIGVTRGPRGPYGPRRRTSRNMAGAI